MGRSYLSRLLIPVDGNSVFPLFTSSGLLVAKGYCRVVIGGRGPYVEFSDDQLMASSIRRKNVPHYYYNEWRTVDVANLKFYQQMDTVGYADYVVGMWYATPSELFDSSGSIIIFSAFRQPIKTPVETLEEPLSIFD